MELLLDVGFMEPDQASPGDRCLHRSTENLQIVTERARQLFSMRFVCPV